MSNARAALQAVYTRRATDGALVGLAPGGVWVGGIPDYNAVRAWTLTNGTVTVTANTLASPTWIEIRPSGGGDDTRETDGAWNDLNVRIEVKSLDRLGAVLAAEDRVDTLLVDWRPTITDASTSWSVTKMADERGGGRAPDGLHRPLWRAAGVYRLRYGT